MKKEQKEYTTLRVEKRTTSLIEEIKLWSRHRDGEKYDNDEALFNFITEYIDDFKQKIIESK